MTEALAFVCGAATAAGLAELALGVGRALSARAPGLVAALAETVTRVGREGRDPGVVERRRLLSVAVVAGFVAGAILVGPVVGLVLGAAAPWIVLKALRARRDRHRRAVDAGAAAVAVALADALGGGHSLRGAVAEAARGGVPGAAGRELRRLAGELALGSRTDDALEALRARVGSQRIDTLVAACLLQRRAGTSRGSCGNAPAPSRIKRDSSTRHAPRPPRRASPAWWWSCSRSAARFFPSSRALATCGAWPARSSRSGSAGSRWCSKWWPPS